MPTSIHIAIATNPSSLTYLFSMLIEALAVHALVISYSSNTKCNTTDI